MNNKLLFFASLSLIISFSCGIFMEITTTSSAMLSTETPAFLTSLWGSIKSDIFAVLLAVVCSATVYFSPVVVIFVLGKTFSLGFSAAYLLSSYENGLGVLLAVLLPRGIFKIPAYLFLVAVSFETARHVKKNLHSKHTLKKGIPALFQNYIICLAILVLSSLIEVFLLQAVL